MKYRSLFFGVSGRFSRGQYWTGLAMCLFLLVAANIVIGLFVHAMPSYGVDALVWPASALAPAICLYVLYLLGTIHVRRLHDMDRTGLHALLAVATIVGIVPLVAICGLQRGTVGANRFGPDPLLDIVATVAVFGDQRR